MDDGIDASVGDVMTTQPSRDSGVGQQEPDSPGGGIEVDGAVAGGGPAQPELPG